MTSREIELMKEAIRWADACKPSKERIPKVGAIISEGNDVIGRGRRGTGAEGDDEHAEWHALRNVEDKDKARLPKSTLFTTLEPCTREVRSDELKCCTELILQHEIKKVFIGILDPNQGVTGKGLWRLQDNGVEVVLFPHGLSQEIRVMNATFIRSQQTLCAEIINPAESSVLKTYETDGKATIRFKARNAPTSNTFVLTFHDGMCWPQQSRFRDKGDGIWETDASFGSVGEHKLHIVTATELGRVLIAYYWKVVDLNIKRREKLKNELKDLSALGGDYPGIQMAGLPKGLHSEASVSITIARKPN